jgi:hypothetical protein
MILLYAAALYVVPGLVVAAAFVMVGVTRVQPQPVTGGARVLLFPAAAALWPYVLIRWIKARPQ